MHARRLAKIELNFQFVKIVCILKSNIFFMFCHKYFMVLFEMNETNVLYMHAFGFFCHVFVTKKTS